MTAQPTPPPAPTFEGRPLPHPDEPVFDQGLTFDVGTLSRRSLLQALGFGAVSAGMCTIIGCQPVDSGASAPTSAGATFGSRVDACMVIPPETRGPFPGDGTNGPNVLIESGVVRQDIRASIGSSNTVATGVPLRIRLQIVDLAKDCAPMANAAVYLWHCDQAGRYSMYSAGAEDENYLRGVQAAGSDGIVTFQSIFPACYQGRWPHVHFEVYPSLDAATDAGNLLTTSQIALPGDVSAEVYATSGYESSVRTFAGVSLETDGVFRDDGGVRQLGTMTGSVASGLTVDLVVPLRA